VSTILIVAGVLALVVVVVAIAAYPRDNSF
jgi:hypothetical protein